MSLHLYEIDQNRKIIELSSFPTTGSFDDVSCQLPQGVYSTFRTFDGGGKVIGLRAHLNRLYKPFRTHNLSPNVSDTVLRESLRTILAGEGSKDFRVRVSLSMSEQQPGLVHIMTEELKQINEEVYQKGVKVVTSLSSRENPRLKSTAFITKSVSERKTLLTHGIYEILMVQNDKILEGMTSNFYAVKGFKIITARNAILLGVTRSIILRLLKKEGCPIDYRPFRVTELPEATEVFISSSSRGAVPVIEVDGITIGQGRPGVVAMGLRKSYDDYVKEKAIQI